MEETQAYSLADALFECVFIIFQKISMSFMFI